MFTLYLTSSFYYLFKAAIDCCQWFVEKKVAAHSSTLAWRIPWTEEPMVGYSPGITKSRTRLSDFTFTFHFHALEKEMATHSGILA